MGDVVQVHTGFSPWKPTDDAELVKEYRHYDIPLEGVIFQRGIRYYFTCLAGHNEPVSFWFYSSISDEEEAALDEDPDSVDFDAPSLLVLAVEGPGIIGAVVLESLDPESVREAAGNLRSLLDSWANVAHVLEPSL